MVKNTDGDTWRERVEVNFASVHLFKQFQPKTLKKEKRKQQTFPTIALDRLRHSIVLQS